MHIFLSFTNDVLMSETLTNAVARLGLMASHVAIVASDSEVLESIYR